MRSDHAPRPGMPPPSLEPQSSLASRRPAGRSFADIRGPGWARFPNGPGGPAGRVTRETLHRIPACISMHRRCRPNYRMSARDPPAREVSLTAACRLRVLVFAGAQKAPGDPHARRRNPPPGHPLVGGPHGWLTGWVNELRPVPTDLAALKDWVAGLSRDELMALAQQVVGGGLHGRLGALGELDPRNREIDLAPPPDEPSLLTLIIELRGSKPRIWRRLSLPGDLTLDVVHTLFQAAMGWTDSHLHRFQPGIGQGYNQPYFVTEFDEEEGEEGTREDGVRLDQVLRAPGDRLTYLYDFGDGWEHRVTLESLDPLTPGDREPVCLGGARACPPEDVGGIHGHHAVAAWLRAGAPADDVPEPFEDAEHAHGWLPVGYDPDAFDAAEATAAMRLWASGEQ